jgi:metal-responsive CopG/Arc/MetJ family transcriptional regulator
MAMGRTQTIVQLSDRLLALLDQRAAATGVSRSELVRRAVESYLRDDAEAAIDAAIVAGYEREPPTEPGALAEALAVASIEEEPW